MKLKIKIPKKWFKVKEGKIQKGDKCAAQGHWETPIEGSPIENYTLVIRQKRQIPEGWEKITKGQVQRRDQLWNKYSKRFEDAGQGNLDNYITSDRWIIREIIKVPEDWYRETKGEIQTGDKFWDYRTKSFEDCPIGRHAIVYTIYVIRKIPEPVVPEGWFRIKHGSMQDGDQIWIKKEMNFAILPGVSHSVIAKSDFVIRLVPEGYLWVGDHFKVGDLRSYGGQDWWEASTKSWDVVADYAIRPKPVIIKLDDEIEIPYDWEQVTDGCVQNNDQVWSDSGFTFLANKNVDISRNRFKCVIREKNASDKG